MWTVGLLEVVYMLLIVFNSCVVINYSPQVDICLDAMDDTW